VLHRTDHGEQDEKHQQGETEYEEGLQIDLLLASKSDVLNHGIHCKRGRQVEHTGDDREKTDHPNVAALRFEERDQTCHG